MNAQRYTVIVCEQSLLFVVQAEDGTEVVVETTQTRCVSE